MSFLTFKLPTVNKELLSIEINNKNIRLCLLKRVIESKSNTVVSTTYSSRTGWSSSTIITFAWHYILKTNETCSCSLSEYDINN